MKKHSPENMMSIATAFVLANGHAEAALRQFNELERYAAQQKKENQERGALHWMARAVPAAVSLALTLELKLKILYYQSHGSYPKTHDLGHVVAQLPRHSRITIAETYEVMYARNIYLNVVEVNFTWNQESRDAYKASKAELAKVQPALRQVSGAYIKWRYVYERMESPEDTHINFWVLLCLIEAVSDAIQKFPGNLHVTFETD